MIPSNKQLLFRQDLESRKRAPLYQKKQEEELKAAQDKAAEAEIRAAEAELKAKEARVRLGRQRLRAGIPLGRDLGRFARMEVSSAAAMVLQSAT